MFKSTNKTTKNLISSAVKLGIFFWIFIATYPLTFADTKNWTPFDSSSLANMFSSRAKGLTSYQSDKYLKEKKLPTDLFWVNKQKYTVKKRGNILNGISTTKKILNTQYANCGLSDNEITSILFFTNHSFAQELRTSLENEKLPTRTQYTSNCKKLTSCIESKADTNLNRKCENIINESYTLGLKEQSHKFLIEESNLWNDIYQNGDTEDSAFDLLYDIQQIGKILFDENKPVTQTLFYKLPSFNTATNTTNNNSTSTSFASSETFTASTSQNSILNPTLSDTKDQENPSRTLPPTVQTISDDPIIEGFLQQHGNEKTTTVKTPAFINYCVIVKDPSNTSQTSQSTQQNSLNPSTPLDTSPENIDAIIQDILANNNTIQQITNPDLPQKDQSAPSQVPTDMNLLGDLKKQLESCTKKCDGLRRDERQICKIQCLCAEYSSPALAKNTKFKFLEEGALKIRICTIPSKITTITTRSKTLYTIEGVLREIQESIDGLYESGELTTKTRTKEFLDTALSKYKFSKNISFIIGLGQKSSTLSVNEKQEQKAEEKFAKGLKENQVSSEQERNRYIIIDEYTSTKQSRTTTKTEWTPQKNENTLTTDTRLTQHKFATLNDQISDFLDKNANLLLELNTTLKEVDQTLKALYQKK